MKEKLKVIPCIRFPAQGEKLRAYRPRACKMTVARQACGCPNHLALAIPSLAVWQGCKQPFPIQRRKFRPVRLIGGLQLFLAGKSARRL